MNDEIREILIFIENKIYPKDSLLFEKWSFLKDYITNLQEENERLNNVLIELEDYIKTHIEVCENRLSTPFCNFEKATKELMIHNNYLDKLKELSKESDKECTD